jgi:hypothetical protein
MGEDPQGIPFNLLPLLGKVATGEREKLLVYGDGGFQIENKREKRNIAKLTRRQIIRREMAAPFAITSTSWILPEAT